jgi:hypothetical protein
VARRFRGLLARPSVGGHRPRADAQAGADAANLAAAALDAPTTQAILRAALLPRGAAAAGLDVPLADALAAALPHGAQLPDSTRALATATGVALLGCDRAAGRGLARFRYRLGAAFVRVPVPSAGGDGTTPDADAAYEAGDACTAWAGPILFFLGRRRRGPLPGVGATSARVSLAHDTPSGPHAPSTPDAGPADDVPVVVAVRTAASARELAKVMTSTVAGGRRLADVLAPGPPPGVQQDRPGGLGRVVWVYPSGAQGPADAWPAMMEWGTVSHRAAQSTWAHACADLTAAAHGGGGGGGGGAGGRGWATWLRAGRRPSSSGPVSPADIIEGHVPPPPGWAGVIGDLVAARRCWEEDRERGLGRTTS